MEPGQALRGQLFWFPIFCKPIYQIQASFLLQLGGLFPLNFAYPTVSEMGPVASKLAWQNISCSGRKHAYLS